jgi:hypothetical protein
MTEVKHRHGCLTAWLSIMILLNAFSIFANIFLRDWLRKSQPMVPAWSFSAYTASAIVFLIGAIALWRWKRWGFHLYLIGSVATFILNLLLKYNILLALLGFVGLAILYGVLQIGGENKGWNKLE